MLFVFCDVIVILVFTKIYLIKCKALISLPFACSHALLRNEIVHVLIPFSCQIKEKSLISIRDKYKLELHWVCKCVCVCVPAHWSWYFAILLYIQFTIFTPIWKSSIKLISDHRRSSKLWIEKKCVFLKLISIENLQMLLI